MTLITQSIKTYLFPLRQSFSICSKITNYTYLFSRFPNAASSANFSSHKVTSLQDGLVLIKGGLSPEEQIKLAKDALERGAEPEKGFWTFNEKGEKILNSTTYRGRIFGTLDSLPTFVTEAFQRSVNQAVEADKTLKPITATHVILLYYKSLLEPPLSGFIPWHQDNGENDGESDYPVVSFTIGDSCDILVNNSKPKLAPGYPASNPKNLGHNIHFESGDVLIFGGPSRTIWHAIYKIHPHTAPHFLPFKNARLNFTFRYTPKILGKEERFATQKSKNLPKDNQFYKLTKMK